MGESTGCITVVVNPVLSPFLMITTQCEKNYFGLIVDLLQKSV